jgi:hypothetical protein
MTVELWLSTVLIIEAKNRLFGFGAFGSGLEISFAAGDEDNLLRPVITQQTP